jgi:hypothetical protein
LGPVIEESRQKIAEAAAKPKRKYTKREGVGSVVAPAPGIGIAPVYVPSPLVPVISKVCQGLGSNLAIKKQMDHWKISEQEGNAVGEGFDRCLQIFLPQVADPRIQALVTLVSGLVGVFGVRYYQQMQIETERYNNNQKVVA